MHQYGTKVVAYFPTPFGWLPLEWYTYGSSQFTMILIGIGIIVSLIVVLTSLGEWWKSLVFYLFINFVFFLPPFLGALGCLGDGCRDAQVWQIAFTWHIATMEVTFAALFLTAMHRLFR